MKNYCSPQEKIVLPAAPRVGWMRDIPPPNDAEDHDPTKLERSVIEHERKHQGSMRSDDAQIVR